MNPLTSDEEFANVDEGYEHDAMQPRIPNNKKNAKVKAKKKNPAKSPRVQVEQIQNKPLH